MKKTLGTIALSLTILAAGFLAMSLPFHLFSELTSAQMRLLWLVELIVYFLIVGICLSAAESRAEKKKAALMKKQNTQKSATAASGRDYDAAA